MAGTGAAGAVIRVSEKKRRVVPVAQKKLWQSWPLLRTGIAASLCAHAGPKQHAQNYLSAEPRHPTPVRPPCVKMMTGNGARLFHAKLSEADDAHTLPAILASLQPGAVVEQVVQLAAVDLEA